MKSIERTCILCGTKIIINVNEEQYDELNLPRSERRKIQQILPRHSAGEREIFISGICGECWDKSF